MKKSRKGSIMFLFVAYGLRSSYDRGMLINRHRQDVCGQAMLHKSVADNDMGRSRQLSVSS